MKPEEKELLTNFMKQKFTPLRFDEIIDLLSGGKEILHFDSSTTENIEILDIIEKATKKTVDGINSLHIKKAKNNTFTVENLFFDVLSAESEISVEKAKTQEGKGKAQGYPRIKVDRSDRTIYITVKTFEKVDDNIPDSPRSFYVSPAPKIKEFKVITDAVHLIVGFGLEETDGIVKSIEYWIVNLEELKMTVKLEFNASNDQIYTPGSILRTGKI